MCAVLTVLQAGAALAYDIRLQGPQDEDLVSLLEGGSLLVEQVDAEEPLDVRDIVSSAQADYKRMLAILYGEGYFGPEISITLDGVEASTIAAVTPPRSVSLAVITIEPGKRFRFGNVDVSPVPPGVEMPESFRTGEEAEITLMQSAARVVVNGWRDLGHAKSALADQKISARHREGLIDAELRIDPGPKLRFGALQLDADSTVRPERILEIAALPEGETFSPDELDDAVDRLRNTGTFRSVTILEGNVAAGSDVLPVELRLADNKPRRFGFGAELATIEGLTLSGFWLHRNLLGGAESLRIDAEIGGIGGTSGGLGTGSNGQDYLLRARFERPATFHEDLRFIALGEIEQEDEPNYFSRQVTVGTGFEYIESDQREYRLGVALRRAQTEDAFGDADYTIFMIPGGTTFDYRDNEFDARKGFYASADLTPFVALAGTDNGLLTELDLRTYVSFGEAKSTTLAFRVQLGSLLGPTLEDAPADFLFYSGGGGSVRGQDYQNLGVRIGTGDDDIVGGRSFLGLSTELRLHGSGSLGYVGFFDAGYVGRNEFVDNSGEWHSGAGLGIRYATPIGPLRFDLAVPVSGDEDTQAFQLYFGIGHAF